jgi:phage-related baseplate assembly protein
MLDRSRVNDAYRALRLALAQGSNLDGLAADRGVVRLTLLPAMGPNPAVMEGDASLLLRTWLKMQAWGTGSVFGVEYHARTLGIVQGASVGKLTLADAKVIDFPGQGRMACTLLPVSGLAAADAEIMRSTIGNTLMDRMRRPGSISIDTVLATIVTVNYAGVLKIRRGVSPVDAPIAARTALQNYMLTRRRVGALVPVSTMQAVQLDYGVVEAQASDPPADVIVPDTAAAELGTVQIETQVIDD